MGIEVIIRVIDLDVLKEAEEGSALFEDEDVGFSAVARGDGEDEFEVLAQRRLRSGSSTRLSAPSGSRTRTGGSIAARPPPCAAGCSVC